MITKTLGPFLMKPTSSSMGFWLCGPSLLSKKSIEVKIKDQSGIVIDSEEFKVLKNSQYGVFIAEVLSLKANTKYNYEIFIDGITASLGLEVEDYHFKTMPSDKDASKLDFALLSCHGIEEFEKHSGSDQEAWDLWERLLQEINDSSNLYFLILGGDQVYMDEQFEKNKKFKGREENEIREKIHNVYLKYWDNLSYRKIMACMPSFLMWDDHDLIDGFGSRPEQFDKNGVEKVEWTLYRKYLTEAFYEFQACRNPSSVQSSGPFSFSLKASSKGFIVLDLRTERNSVLSQLLLDDHKKKIELDIDILIQQNVDTIFFVSPVTMARMGGDLEHIIGKTANYLWVLSHNLGRDSILAKSGVWTLFTSLCFIFAQMKFEGKSGQVSAVSLFFFCALNLIMDLINNKNYLSKKITKILRVINIAICISIATYAGLMWDWVTPFQNMPLFIIHLKESFVDSFVIEFRVLILVWMSVALLLIPRLKGLSKASKKACSYGATACVVMTLIALTWIGLPNGKSSLLDWVWLIPMCILQLFGIVFYILALAEASGTIDTVAGLDDDVKDSWSSETNSKELQWLRKNLEKIQKAGIKPVILSGDIHTGGVSKMSFDKKFSNPKKFIFQIVSSPMSYVPMENIVEKLTSGNSVNSLIQSVDGLYSYNLFYRCERNFAFIKTDSSSNEVMAEFYFESTDSPEKVFC